MEGGGGVDSPKVHQRGLRFGGSHARRSIQLVAGRADGPSPEQPVASPSPEPVAEATATQHPGVRGVSEGFEAIRIEREAPAPGSPANSPRRAARAPAPAPVAASLGARTDQVMSKAQQFLADQAKAKSPLRA